MFRKVLSSPWSKVWTHGWWDKLHREGKMSRWSMFTLLWDSWNVLLYVWFRRDSLPKMLQVSVATNIVILLLELVSSIIYYSKQCLCRSGFNNSCSLSDIADVLPDGTPCFKGRDRNKIFRIWKLPKFKLWWKASIINHPFLNQDK